jgi:membrane protein DedA with SNARE-associated domain
MHAVLAALLDVPSAVVLVVVFLLPAIEASTLAGVVIPGETALLYGGVLAWHDRVPLAAVFAAGALGAVIGDSIGYLVGARWGKGIVEGRIGRLIGEQRWDRARRHLARKGLFTIIVGRFPPIARTLVPILAGSARMPYHRFLLGNVVGGVVWAIASTSLGYFAGNAWRRVERVQHIVGLVMAAAVVAIVVALVARQRRRRRRHSTGGHAAARA